MTSARTGGASGIAPASRIRGENAKRRRTSYAEKEEGERREGERREGERREGERGKGQTHNLCVFLMVRDHFRQSRTWNCSRGGPIGGISTSD